MTPRICPVTPGETNEEGLVRVVGENPFDHERL